MPRQKLSEYRAKQIICAALETPYIGWSIDATAPLQPQLAGAKAARGRFVVKVDEGVKGRFKRGLVLLDVDVRGLAQAARALHSQGWRWLIVEPMVVHDGAQERYLALQYDRQGLLLQYSAHGGIDVEAQAEQVRSVRITAETDWEALATQTGVAAGRLQRLVAAFRDNFFAFMEINPYVAQEAGAQVLDAAVLVDDAAAFWARGWQETDLRHHRALELSPEEQVVQELNAKSPASFSLSVLKPNGSIFLLLSGGGASVVVADEVFNQGYGAELANYGEYSGNPTTEETYLYTRAVLHLLLRSKAASRVLFIGGAVANFTDIAKTFAGVVQAIDEVAPKLRAGRVRVFVRRGGPNQEVGLAKLRQALEAQGLLGAVYDPTTPLTTAVQTALAEVPHHA